MLIIRGGSDVLPLQTEDHIYHFRAVKQRFMNAQREFRKHRMPDPSESAHFGRWSDCANEVMKQRALGEPEPQVDDNSGPDESQDMPELQQVAAGAETVAIATQPASPEPVSNTPPNPGRFNKGLQVSGTLADQARALSPLAPEAAPAAEPTPASEPAAVPDVGVGTEIPPLTQAEFATLDAMPTPIEPVTGRLPPVSKDAPATVQPESRGADSLLDDLAFVRRGHDAPRSFAAQPESELPDELPTYSGVVPGTVGAPGGVDRRKPRKAPPPGLGEIDGPGAAAADGLKDESEASESSAAVSTDPAPHPLDTPGFNVNRNSLVDRDDAPPMSQPATSLPKFRGYHDELAGETDSKDSPEDDWLKGVPPFDSSLITNRDPEE
jgi:hypothetical protein